MSRADSERAFEIWEKFEELRPELEELEDGQLEVAMRWGSCPCWLPDELQEPPRIRREDLPDPSSLAAYSLAGEVRRTMVGPSAVPYWRFGTELKQVAEASGFWDIELADLVLTGKPPQLLPRAQIARHPTWLGRGRLSMPTPGTHQHSYLTIRLNSPLNREETRKLFAEIRSVWETAYKPTPDVQLLLLVADRELGDDEHFHRKEPWERIGSRLTKLGYGGETNPHALAMQYERWRDYRGPAVARESDAQGPKR